MEAQVWSGTGLLPDHLEIVRLTTLADGGWQARCEFDAGEVRTLRFAAEGAKALATQAFRRELHFTEFAASETARRLFEPFEVAADWP